MTTQKMVLRDFFSKHKTLTILLFLSSFLSSASLLLIPIFVGKYYDILFEYHTFRARILAQIGIDFSQDIHRLLIFLGIVIGLHAGTLFAQRFFTKYLGEKMALYIRRKLFLHFIEAPLSVFDRKPVGKLLLRFTGDIRSIQDLVTKGMIRFCSDLLFIVVIILVLFSLQPRLTALLSSSIPLFALLFFVFHKRLRANSQRVRSARANMAGFVTERLQSILSVKVFEKQKEENKTFRKLSKKLFHRAIRFHAIDSLIHVFLVVILYGTLLGILKYAADLYHSGNNISVNGGMLTAYIMLLLTAFPFIKRTLRVQTLWQKAQVSFEKIIQSLNLEMEGAKAAPVQPSDQGHIVLNDIHFAYRAKKPILKNLTCRFVPGKINKVSGQNGSGKSTVFKLILGLYRPDSGTIFVDGIPINPETSKPMRRFITLVSPETRLLGQTVLDAVCESPNPRDIKKAESLIKGKTIRLLLGSIHDLNQKIGEGGRLLSAGQKTALMLVRALISGKKFLLLDEPFLALDSQGKAALWELLHQIKHERTIVLIDHEYNNKNDVDPVFKLSPQAGLKQTGEVFASR